MRNAEEMFSFGPNPTRAKNAWSSSICLLYEDNIQAFVLFQCSLEPPASRAGTK